MNFTIRNVWNSDFVKNIARPAVSIFVTALIVLVVLRYLLGGMAD